MAQVKPSRRQLKVDIKRSGKFVNLIFTDGGDGVSTEAAGNLFKSFYSTKPNGMGLGLSLSRTLIERFGGELSWRNLTDFGAEFTIRLPLVLE
jgi:C4-dicarboxylate-specific signal transduction histidine kinase